MKNKLQPNYQNLPNSTTLYDFGNYRVRAKRDDQSRTWFAASDVCEALGIKNVQNALRSLPPELVGAATTEYFRGDSVDEVATINEGGLYSLILRSRKPEAKTFQSWLTRIVLPTLREDGGYIVGEETLVTDDLTPEEFLSNAVELDTAADLSLDAKQARLIQQKKHRRNADELRILPYSRPLLYPIQLESKKRLLPSSSMND